MHDQATAIYHYLPTLYAHEVAPAQHVRDRAWTEEHSPQHLPTEQDQAVPTVVEEVVRLPRGVQQERTDRIQHTQAEKIIDAPAPMMQVEHVHIPVVQQQERTMHSHVEEIIDVPEKAALTLSPRLATVINRQGETPGGLQVGALVKPPLDPIDDAKGEPVDELTAMTALTSLLERYAAQGEIEVGQQFQELLTTMRDRFPST